MKLYASVLVMALLAGTAMGDVLATYSFGNELEGGVGMTMSPDYVAPGASATDFSAGSGVSPALSAYLSDQDPENTSPTTDATLFVNNNSTASDAVAADAYVEITIDDVVAIDSICFDLGAGGTSNAPRAGFLRSSLDGFTGDLLSWELYTIPATPQNVSVGATDLTGPVSFRFYVYNTGRANRGYRIDDVTVNGTVPEPATMSLLGLGGLAILRRRRK